MPNNMTLPFNEGYLPVGNGHRLQAVHAGVVRRARSVLTILLHGTHDWRICPPENAARLMRFMPHAQLGWIKNGTHVASDPAIAKALRGAIRDLQRRA